jgi:hypothetical protein
MRETVLRDFFLGRVTPFALARDVLGSKKKVGAISYVVEVEGMEGEFSITREMLVSLWDTVLSGQLPPEELAAIGFALVASNSFMWDTEDVVHDVIHDWSSPEVFYPLTIDNVQRFKNWLLGLEPHPAEREPTPHPQGERLIAITEKKSLPKRQGDS